METMSSALRTAIERDGRSQPVIADAAGIDKGILSRFMRAERSLTLTTADRVCDALAVDVRLVKRRVKKGGAE
ncbi:MAG: helix-turn-helix transcriptional regulator [Planctomycetota bacterium]